MVFPAYTELENRTPSRFAYSSAISIVIYTIALISTGIVCVLLFGRDLKPDLLDNVATRKSGLSIVLRIIYCLVLLFHLPYIFFTVKEYTLVMYDEYMERGMSKRLDEKIGNREATYYLRSSNNDDEQATPLMAQP